MITIKVCTKASDMVYGKKDIKLDTELDNILDWLADNDKRSIILKPTPNDRIIVPLDSVDYIMLEGRDD